MDDLEMLKTVKSGLRGVSGMTLFTSNAPVTITDVNTGNPAVSMFGPGRGAKKLPAYSLTFGKMLRYTNKSILSARNGKDSTIIVTIDGLSYSSTITYTANFTNSFADIDLDIIVTAMSGNIATVSLMGRSQFAPTSGSNVYTRFIIGTINNLDTTQDSLLDVQFQWSDLNFNSANTITSVTNILQLVN